MKSNQPIGIFDSGIGGLTVAKAVKNLLPNEQLIYFGDTAHLPYGDKSVAAIQAYSVRITEMLLRRKCKVILIACNSASSAAFELVTEYVGKKAHVLDVINPTIDFIRERHLNSRIGLIGTKQTVSSLVYEKMIRELQQNNVFNAVATPLLVPMIEEGFSGNHVSEEIIKTYLSDDSISEIDALILGCTHYPIIKSEISQYYSNESRKVEVIDSAEKVAGALKGYLEFNQLIAESAAEKDEFLVSDFTESFEKTTKIFFGKEVHLEKIPIWDEMN
ncbi:MAG: glutamate racemase [Cyclobacteriaceae bacterium]